jgi:cellulose synthase/poly-beta-1,6-N-acetylglucosamine synthase-like glycosyltransferase
VVIPARNEEEKLPALLKALQDQSYPQDFFEVIVVDDYSTDGTARIVKASSLPGLRLIQPYADSKASSKKKAIETAVRISKGELIVTTDADCLPLANWLQTINAMYVQRNAAFIAAPVKCSHNQSLVQKFQAVDFLTLQGITAASVALQFHTMCNGANLAYNKQSFLNVNGFAGIDKVATGDDMLLMYKIWKKDPRRVFYLKSRQAIVTTEPMLTWKAFFRQRKRWASKTLVYDDLRIIAVLGFVYLFNCLFLALLAAALFNPVYWLYVAGYLLLKTAIEWPFVSSVAQFYGEQRLMKYFFPLQPLHIFYTVVVGALSQFGKYEWKGRRVR